MKYLIRLGIAALIAFLFYQALESNTFKDLEGKVTGMIPGKSAEYKPIKRGGPLPKEIFGLRNAGKGIWKDASGNTVYEQARVYAGGSKSQPLPPVRKGGCTYKKDPVTVVVDSRKYPASALHLFIAARNGVPEILHINRDPGYDLRANSLEGIPSNSTFDRDEVPFAVSNEAVVYNRVRGTSDIAYIPFSDNRGSGSSMGGQLSGYCTGQSFRIQLDPAK
jgi:hypothetical protein